MFEKPSLITRIVIGQSIGLLIGIIGFVVLPYFAAEASYLFRWGILLWYTTFGSIIAVFGIFTYHPILKFPLPWWFRDSFIGAWMNFVLVFFTYDAMQSIMVSFFGENGLMTSPFWFVLEGALVGLLIGFLAAHFGGEGKETV